MTTQNGGKRYNALLDVQEENEIERETIVDHMFNENEATEADTNKNLEKLPLTEDKEVDFNIVHTLTKTTPEGYPVRFHVFY